GHRARRPRRSQDRRGRPEALGDVGGQRSPDRHHADPPRADLVQLRLLAVTDEQRDLVTPGLELEGGIHHQTPGPTDAQAGADEGNAQRRGRRHRSAGSLPGLWRPGALPCYIRRRSSRRLSRVAMPVWPADIVMTQGLHLTGRVRVALLALLLLGVVVVVAPA